MNTAAGGRPADVPVDIGRDEARQAAVRELSDPIYTGNEPGLLERAARWLLERLDDLLNGLSGVAPGGIAGVIVLLVLAVVVAAIVRLRVGKIARTRRVRRTVLGERTRSADEHRAAAEEALARGDHNTAVTERFRAIVRVLERRAALQVRDGHTADEIAVAAGAVLPALAEGLRGAARVFDDVYYGGHQATLEQYQALALLDEQVSSARPALAGPVR